MPKTLLAVDDSATMRKVLEITFGGEDFRVVTAEGASSALGRMSEEPLAAVIDTSLGGDDGYALAKEIRARDPKVAVVLLSSRNTPYDANRGRDAGADDFIDKPFDTQALIDKVKKALAARDAQKAAAAAPPVHAAPAPAPAASRGPGIAPVAPPAPSIAQKPAWPGRTHTLSFEGGVPGPAAAPPPVVRPAAPSPASAATLSPKPAPAPSRAAAPPASRAAAPAVDAAVSAAAGAGLSAKLGDLGLTPQQAEAVLALSREVVERVVWEVVPQLAEVLIKEEIARLTKEG